MNPAREHALQALGFRFGRNGPHAARTMMFEELTQLFGQTGSNFSPSDYADAVIQQNVLGKPTKKARELTYRHLNALYGLDVANPIFRALRRLWPMSPSAQPLLALAVALARDPLLRGTQKFVLSKPVGQIIPREEFENLLALNHPNRFSPASLRSFAQNVAGTWTSAGFLRGRASKVRVHPDGHAESVTLLLFLGFLEGLTGQRLLSSGWTSLLSSSPDVVEALAASAAHRGLLVFMNAGGVKEIRFPDYLTADEEFIRQGIENEF
jgi:hypothetical protein